MSVAYKQFLASDIIVTPFVVNKGFSFKQSEWGAEAQVDKFLGTSGSFLTNTSTTGVINTEYQVLVYNSVKELYYSNFLTQSYGDVLQVGYIVPGVNSEGNVLVGSPDSTGRYFNYLQSTLTASRFWPTGSGAQVGVISVSAKLFGEYIQPNSFKYEFISASITHTLTDDGEGNLLSGSINVGNIIYPHGLAIITSQLLASGSIDVSNVTCSFSSSMTIYETQYKCTIRENEFNFSLNPSLISGSTDGTAYNYVTSSYFSPYVTTVGLYDEYQNLLAIGKLAQPLPTTATTDTTILINIDR
jgi:hypothetical protein